MEFQFIRTETYSRKPDKGGRTVDWILDEVSRVPDACKHVKTPGVPILVYGMPVEELRRIHDDAVSVGRAELPNGSSRAIRKDQNTLHTVVASHPGLTIETIHDESKISLYKAWESDTVGWLSSLYGNDLKTVIRHEDESHLHIHAYILPADLKANVLHPGTNARDRSRKDSLAKGLPKLLAEALADQAYKDAMSAWQNAYHESVAIKHGFAKAGRGSPRLSRAEWHATRNLTTSFEPFEASTLERFGV